MTSTMIATATTPAEQTLDRTARQALGDLDAIHWYDTETDDCSPHLFGVTVLDAAWAAVDALPMQERYDLVEAREDNVHYVRICNKLRQHERGCDYAVASLILAMYRLTEEPGYDINPVVDGD
ncbi:MAG TPA: hypothetical protein VF597_03470 [Candidatus Saccharimonadales bacterium]|jgi:hypothetical protein